MKLWNWIVAVAWVGFSLPAHAATTDPFMVLYVWSGALDNGAGAGSGIASSVHCSSFSNVTETLQFLVKLPGGGITGNATTPIAFASTVTASTHGTNAYSETLFLNTGPLNQGSMAVLATSTNIFCTAQVLDAANTVPVGMSLHGIRFNPIPGTLE